MARAKRSQKDFDCLVCGETVPAGAKSCPECGACEKSGWSQDTTYDGLDLPGHVFEDEKLVRVQFDGDARRKRMQRFWSTVALILLIALALPFLRSCAH
jgi:hypothetical protein